MKRIVRAALLFAAASIACALPAPAAAMIGVGHGSGGSGSGPADIYSSLQSRLVEDSRFLREAILDRLRDGIRDVSDPWAMGYRGGGHDLHSSAASADSDSYAGGIAGLEYDPIANLRLGLAVGHSETWLASSASASAGDVGATQVALYAGSTWQGMELRAGFLYAWQDASLRRIQSSTIYRASFGATSAQLFVEADTNFDFDDIRLTPFATMAWLDQETGRFAESAGGYLISGAHNNVGTADVGLRFKTQCDVDTVALAPFLSIAWQRAFGDLLPTVAATTSGSSGIVPGVPIAANAGALHAGVSVLLSKTATLSFVYDGVFTHRASDEAGGGELAIRF